MLVLLIFFCITFESFIFAINPWDRTIKSLTIGTAFTQFYWLCPYYIFRNLSSCFGIFLCIDPLSVFPISGGSVNSISSKSPVNSSAHSPVAISKLLWRQQTTWTWWRLVMESLSTLLTFYEGNPPVMNGTKGQWYSVLILLVWVKCWTNSWFDYDLRRYITRMWRHCTV